jgi:hypothetical protein
MKVIILATAMLASSVMADTNDHAYIPNETNCKYTATYTAPFMPIVELELVDQSCMERQKINAGLRYCAKFGQHCADQVVMIGDQALLVKTPSEDSSFYLQEN